MTCFFIQKLKANADYIIEPTNCLEGYGLIVVKLRLMKKRTLIISILLILAFGSIGFAQNSRMNINEIGLSVLSWIKKIKGNSVKLGEIAHRERPLISHQIWSDLLEKYVTEDGNVNYQGFLTDSVALNRYLALLSENPPGNNWSEADRLAYWINVYNAFTVKLILNHYPLKSIKDISDGLPMLNSPWDIKFFKIGDTPFDLNTVEHEILRKQFNEPRIHFAINCASFSCPKLRTEAYEADKLEQQLAEQARDFLNNPEKNLITENEIRLSKIFDWFKNDFTRETDLLAFIKKYYPSLSTNTEVEYMEYDWTLNEAQPEK
jgi:hypothetical protein